MDLNDALQRVVLRHLALIVGCVMLAALLSLATSVGADPPFASTARVSSGAQVARSSQEAAAQAAQVEAVATSRSVVAKALAAIGLHRSPTRIARDRVGVRGLGTSPVMALTVQDRSPSAARSLTQALAEQVVVELGRPRAMLERQQVELRKSIASLRARRNEQLASAATLLSPKVSAELVGIDSQISSLGEQLVGVGSQLGDTLEPRVVDGAGPARQLHSSRVPDAALAGVLGLVVGLGIAATRESLRPTVVGVSSLSRLFAAPALGTVDQRDGVRMGLSLARLATRVDIAARRVDTNVVALAGPIPEQQLADLAHELDYLLGGNPQARVLQDVAASQSDSHRPGQANGKPARGGAALRARSVVKPQSTSWDSVRVLPCDDLALSLMGRGDQRVGVLVVAPRSTPRDGLLHVEDVIGTTGWPLIGVVTAAANKIGVFRLTDALRVATRGMTRGILP
jgi:capsular polysaccharide biosynthesis protein